MENTFFFFFYFLSSGISLPSFPIALKWHRKQAEFLKVFLMQSCQTFVIFIMSFWKSTCLRWCIYISSSISEVRSQNLLLSSSVLRGNLQSETHIFGLGWKNGSENARSLLSNSRARRQQLPTPQES